MVDAPNSGVLVSSGSVMDPAVWKDPDGGGALAGQQTGHLIEGPSSDRLAVHLQDFIPDPQQGGVDVLRGPTSDLFHIDPYDESTDVCLITQLLLLQLITNYNDSNSGGGAYSS